MYSAKKINGVLMAIVTCCCFLPGACSNRESEAKAESITDIKQYRTLLSEMRNKPRALIYDNDGNDVIREETPADVPYYMYPADKEFSIETFLERRTTPLKGSDVKTIAYCTLSSGFGQFTHNTKYGTFYQGDPENKFPDTATYRIRTVIPSFVKLGTDPLHVVCEYGEKNDFEVIWSFRMNDTHDASWEGDVPAPLWTKFKQDHPQYLFGKKGENLPYGQWSSVNFALPEIRDLAVKFFTEVCENYDVDGIELDFFRHLSYLKSVAEGKPALREEIDSITSMIATIRQMTERVGMKKGKPLLVAVRLPDSFEYSRAIGLDLERWMKEGLVDIVIGSCYFRLNPWSNLVEMGKNSEAKMYAGLSESRILNEHRLLLRNKNHVYQARAAGAWQAGVDGLYSLNEYNPHMKYLRVIGEPAKLRKTNKLYFVTDVCPPYNAWNSPNGYLKDGERLYTIPILSPQHPVKISEQPLGFPMEIGDESEPAKACVILYTRDVDPELLQVSLNNSQLTLRKTLDSLSVFDVANSNIVAGKNLLQVKLGNGAKYSKSKTPMALDAAILLVRDTVDQDLQPLAEFCFGKQ